MSQGGKNRLTKEEIEITKAFMALHKRPDGTYNVKAMSRESGINRSTLRRRILTIENMDDGAEYEAPEIVESDLSVEEIISRNKKTFERKQAAEASKKWMRFKVKAEGPFCLAIMGDPHVDADGCNWPLLERDIALIRDTDAMWGVNVGDYTNNWSGRLQRIYAEQSTTRSEAWKLAEWIFGQKKPNRQSMWWLLVKGNHDLWSGQAGNGDPLDWMARGEAALKDWQAQIVAVSGKHEFPLHFAHDFPGHSMYNPLHGPMRKGRFTGDQARVFACGDKHNWASMEIESQDIPGHIYWAIRARGYKYIDSYADRLGYGSQNWGASVGLLIEPDKQGPAQIRCYPDLEEAVDILNFKRRGL